MLSPLFRARGCLRAVLMALACTSAHAEMPALSLAEALHRVETRSPRLAQQAAEQQAARARVESAGLRANPELRLSLEDALGSGARRGLDQAELTLSLVQILEPAARRAARLDAAQSGSALSAAAFDVTLWELRADTHRRYAIAVIRQGHLALARDAATSSQQLLRVTQQRVQAAAAPLAELERARIALVRAELDEEDQEHELAAARMQLAALWNGVDDFGPLSADPFSLPRLRSLDEWQAALGSSPALRRFAAERALLRAERASSATQRQFLWQLEGGLRHYRDNDDVALIAGFSLPLRLRDPQAPQLAEWDAKLAAAEAGEAAALAEARAELFSLYQELKHGALHLRRLQNDIVPAAERLLAETERAVQRGRYGAWEWLQARQLWLDARKEMLNDAELLHTNLAALERISGLALLAPESASTSIDESAAGTRP